ncbi:helicase-related protein [Bernardetia sp. OM2101]|uniref:helicase-related protein n=1 Tax=Bernardetia sp. OM2101 TaxID=3344876 RepID=UPI0035D0A712
MQHYSAGYTNTTNHFVIQNLPFFSQKVVEEEKTKFAFLLRFLQRSLVMPLPVELAERFNTQDNQTENYIPLLPLQISEKNKYIPKWKFEEKTQKTTSEKAMTLFLRERLQNYLPEWGFLECLFLANAPLSDVLQQEIAQDDINAELKNAVVNFYLPIAELAVLIVDSREREIQQKVEQKLRSKGIYVVSFTAEEIIEETDLIREKMEWIRHQVEKPIFSNKLREWNRTATNQPRETIIQQIWWKAALIRIQILTAELLFRGIWKVNPTNNDKNKAWKAVFLMREKEQIPKEIIELAIQDIQKLVVELFPNLSTDFPQIAITTVFSENDLANQENKSIDNKNNNEILKIDFSILHRWTDSDKNKDWIKIRNDYAENYRFSFHSDEGKPLSKQLPILSHSFFKINSKNTFHNWNFDDNNDLKRSEFLFHSISNKRENTSSFLQILLAKALNGQSVLANLPLEIDSSFIFGWLSVLQSSPSLLICASTDAALDKMEELSKNGIDKVTIWHSEMSSQEVRQAQNLIKENKVFLLILTADLLNTTRFINFINNEEGKKNENDKINWAYFLVDEIHRFSEWSPQHKEEYIALERIYYNYFYNDSHKTPFVFLSNFLDKSVSKTIQNTFKIEKNNFYAAVSSSDYVENKISNFEFIETENTYSALVNILKKIQNKETKHPNNTGVIFTSGVNGSTGSYLLSERLEFDLKRKIYPYSVEIPNDSHDDNETHFTKRTYLRNALKTSQDLLVASTSALNSGINLENLDFIVQYGLPKSLTELLDISNRTKKPTAKTYIIFQKEKDEQTLLNLFKDSTKLSDIRNMHREVSWLGGDMYRHLLEWAAKVEPVEEEVDFMKQFYDKYCLVSETEIVDNKQDKENTPAIIKISEVEISDLDFRVFSQKVNRKLAVERTIIRFYQMGILSNWEYSTHISNTKFKIWVQAHDQTSVRKHIFEIIQTHQSDFEIHKDEKYSTIFSMKNYSILEKYSFLFLQWIHENSIYHLKNNLKEVYDYAKSQVKENQAKSLIFSEPFLHHSSINRLLYFTEKDNTENNSFSKTEINWVFEELEKMNDLNNDENKELNLDFIEKWRKRINQNDTNNTVLDFYKAVLELHLEIFDSENAPKTLFHSLSNFLKGKTNDENKDYFIEKFLSFGNNFSEQAKSYLSESILKNEFAPKTKHNFQDKHLRATQIYASLKDMYSLNFLLQSEIEKMKIIQFEVQES